MYRRGIVEEVDAATHRVKVKLPDRDNIISGWLEVVVRSSHGDQDQGMPQKGNQVACLFDEKDEAGCVLGAVYSKVDAPADASEDVRRFAFEDGGVVEYDKGSHTLRITIGAGFLELAGNAEAVAMAGKVLDAFTSLSTAIASHTHLSAAPTFPTGPPVAWVWQPSAVGSAKVKTS